MDPPGNEPGDDQTVDCVFDITISDSEFDLKDEIAGKCEPGNCPEDETDEEEEEGYSPRGSKGFSAENGSSFGSAQSSSGGGQSIPGAPGSSTDPSTINSGMEYEDPVYHGLASPAARKHYRSDYPGDLRLKKLCNPKGVGNRATVDNYRTHPLARFTPPASKITFNEDGSIDETGGGNKDETAQRDLVDVEAVKKQCKQRTRGLPPIVSVSDEAIIDYLEDFNIQMLLEYFLGMCILNTPEDPFQYIADIAAQLIQARTDATAFENIPRVLTPAHVDSMFRLYDRLGSGFLTYNQYKNAFESMGLVRYDLQPKGFATNEIDKDTFNTAANDAMTELFRSFMNKTSRAADDC